MSSRMNEDLYVFKRDVRDAIETWAVFSMPKEDRIKLWIKYTVFYQYDNHENCIDTSSVENSSNNSLMGYYRKCVSEVEALRRDRISRNFTAFDFVTEGNSLVTGLTDTEFMILCKLRSENVQHEIYPIYEDMVLDKATETYRRLSGRSGCIVRSLYRSEWENIFLGKTVMLKLDKCDSVSVIDNNNGVCKVSDFEDAFPNWEDLKSHYVGEAKLVLKEALLSELSGFMINEYIAFSCYPFLLSYYNACMCEIRMMQKDRISKHFTLHTLLLPLYRQLLAVSPTSAVIEERLFKRLLKQKYILYKDTVASGIKRSFLTDMMVGLCISIEVSDNSSKNAAKENLILVPHVTRKVCDFLPQADLLNLLLAYSLSYNNPTFIEEPPTRPKRKNNVSVAHCKRLTRSKKYL